jgi:hypothetical protein
VRWDSARGNQVLECNGIFNHLAPKGKIFKLFSKHGILTKAVERSVQRLPAATHVL